MTIYFVDLNVNNHVTKKLIVFTKYVGRRTRIRLHIKYTKINIIFTVSTTADRITPKTNIPLNRSFKQLSNGTGDLYTFFERNGQKIKKKTKKVPTFGTFFTP